MAQYVMVRYVGKLPVVVGHAYMMHDEQREISRGDFENLQQVLGDLLQLVPGGHDDAETDAAIDESPDAEKSPVTAVTKRRIKGRT